MSLKLPLLFESHLNPGHHIHYVSLNPLAEHTFLFCYGAGGSSTFLNLFEDFLVTHPNLALLCVDRWVLGEPTTSGQALLSSLSSITIELLDYLSIAKVSLAAHSAGVYQTLHLVSCYPERITGLVFPICAHIPAPFTA